MDTRLEVAVLPVSDVDRARDFYQALGWRLDADFSCSDPDGNTWFVQEVTTRLPGRSTSALASFDSVAGLAAALRRAAAAHGKHEEEIGHADPNWPDWYAQYLQAREAAASAQVDVEAALAYRDFMVSDYSDAGQQAWLAGKGIDLIRGTGRLAGPGTVEVGGTRYTAGHVVVATGADPVIPPITGLRELDGIWTNREVTGMKAVPRRWVTPSARCCAAKASNCSSACTRTPRGGTVRSTC